MIYKVIIMTAHVLNVAFIDEPENARRVHYCQRKSATRALIRRESVIPSEGRQAVRLLAISVETSWLLFLSQTITILNLPKRAMMKTLTVGRILKKVVLLKYLKPQSTVNPSACLTICAPLSTLCSGEQLKMGVVYESSSSLNRLYKYKQHKLFETKIIIIFTTRLSIVLSMCIRQFLHLKN
uniref:Secreted protein n=1 Tax=Heterorhabditis bacteriophora TaxID=37862 RepID=A0A1I7WZS6_HETBA